MTKQEKQKKNWNVNPWRKGEKRKIIIPYSQDKVKEDNKIMVNEMIESCYGFLQQRKTANEEKELGKSEMFLVRNVAQLCIILCCLQIRYIYSFVQGLKQIECIGCENLA